MQRRKLRARLALAQRAGRRAEAFYCEQAERYRARARDVVAAHFAACREQGRERVDELLSAGSWVELARLWQELIQPQRLQAALTAMAADVERDLIHWPGLTPRRPELVLPAAAWQVDLAYLGRGITEALETELISRLICHGGRKVWKTALAEPARVAFWAATGHEPERFFLTALGLDPEEEKRRARRRAANHLAALLAQAQAEVTRWVTGKLTAFIYERLEAELAAFYAPRIGRLKERLLGPVESFTQA